MSEQIYLSLGKPLGSWVWNVSYYVAEPSGMLDFCRKNNVTELYFSINRDVTNQSYVNLIHQADRYGIRSAALSGDPAWILPEMQSSYRQYLQRVRDINSLCGKGPKFYSIHLDVEPHVLPAAKKEGMDNYARTFVEFVKDARKQADEMGVMLEWDIPAWFWKFNDKEHACKLNETVFRYCDAVGIMSYGDSASSQISKSMPNVEVARKLGKRVMIGCETMDLDEARRDNGNCSISYFEEGKEYMYRSLEKVRETITEEYDDIGFAIHHISTWYALQDGVLSGFEGDLEG